MRVGDIVRFAKWEEVDIMDSSKWPQQPKPNIGVLVDHDKLMGTVQVLCDGQIWKIRSQFAEKAGKKDIENQRKKKAESR